MHSAVVGWIVLYRSVWSAVLFLSSISLLIFCLDFLSIIGLNLQTEQPENHVEDGAALQKRWLRQHHLEVSASLEKENLMKSKL